MMKKIDFPIEEVEQLKNKDRIITTRVSREYNCYHEGEMVQTPWDKQYFVEKIEKFNDVSKHPYYQDLTKEQIRLISRYKKIAVLTLKKHKIS